MTFTIAEFSFPEDWPAVLELWQNAGEGIQLRESDSPEEIHKKLQRDPELFLVARVDGVVAAAVMGGYDGRRGFIYHLAVAQAFRHRGLARMIMAEVENRLKSKGCLKVNLLVTPENKHAMAFYESIGYEPMTARPFGKKLI